MKRRVLIAAAVLLGAPAVWFALSAILSAIGNSSRPAPIPIVTTDRYGRPSLR